MTSFVNIKMCSATAMVEACPEWVWAIKHREQRGEQKSEEWLMQRHSMITASDAAAASMEESG